MNNIVFLGAPGSGKGTQAKILSEKLGIEILSIGDRLRYEILIESEVGKVASNYVSKGALVPDEVVTKIVLESIKDPKFVQGFILDGYPRNLSQAESLKKSLAENNKNLTVVINIDVSDDVIIKRLSGRYACDSCGELYNKFFKTTKIDGICDVCQCEQFTKRKDDNEDTIKERLKIYHKLSQDLIDYYQKNNLIISVSGLDDTSRVSSRIYQLVSGKLNNN